MLSQLPFLLLVASLIASTVMGESIHFINHCTYPIYFFEVGAGFAGEDYQGVPVPSGGYVTHPMRNTEGMEGGVSLKIRDVPKYRTAPAGILQVEYNLRPVSTKKIFYDLSLVDCSPAAGPTDPRFCPLIQGGVKMHVPGHEDKGCPPASCDAQGCDRTYLLPGPTFGDPTLSCNAGLDIHFETCIDGNGPVTILKKPGVSPPPSQGLGSKPVAHGPLQVSSNGLCGAETGFTCAGSAFGQCCSKWNFCGDNDEYCGAGCQKDFSSCGGSSKPALGTLLTITKPRQPVPDVNERTNPDQTHAQLAEDGQPMPWTKSIQESGISDTSSMSLIICSGSPLFHHSSPPVSSASPPSMHQAAGLVNDADAPNKMSSQQAITLQMVTHIVTQTVVSTYTHIIVTEAHMTDTVTTTVYASQTGAAAAGS